MEPFATSPRLIAEGVFYLQYLISKKRAVALALVGLMLCLLASGLFSATPGRAEAEQPSFWTMIDGSTATIPLSEALAMRYLGITQAEASRLIKHNTTPLAYDNLLYTTRRSYPEKEVALIFVTAPSKYELEWAAKEGIELEYVPVAHDALVFLNNVRNPVTGLTKQQLLDIYTGKLTAWSEVGGEEVAIIPFQRSLRSGSQTLFEELLMAGTAPMDAPVAHRPSSMGELVDEVSNYENGQSSLGYSVYYYIKDMYGNDRLRMLAIDGVAPEDGTILDHSYPFFTYYYAVFPKALPQDDPHRKLVEWLLTDEGQRLVRQAGYLPLREVEVAP